MTAPSALAVRELAVDLGGRRVLHDVDLEMRPGEFVGLIGPNGAGKTTLLRSVLGLVRTAHGTIAVDGTPGYVPQRHEFAWDFPISVESVVMTGRRRAGGWPVRPRVRDHVAVADALRRVGMTDLRRRPVGQLSGGQRQRVLVARALASDPAVLLLDEPFTGLDMPTQDLLLELFAGLAADGRAVLMTTHDLLGALHSCQRICLINRTIVADGPSDRLRDPGLWMRTFDIGPASPLLTVLGVR